MVVFFPERGDFLHHLLLLIHLDRINPPIFTPVFQPADCPLKRFVQLCDSRIKNIPQTKQGGQFHAAFLDPRYHFHQAYGVFCAVTFRTHQHFAFRGNTKIPVAPIPYSVQFRRFFNRPAFQGVFFHSQRSNPCRVFFGQRFIHEIGPKVNRNHAGSRTFLSLEAAYSTTAK